MGPRLLLGAAMLAASFGQMALGALAPVLRNELSLSVGDIGMVGTVLFASAAVWSPVAGRLADRVGGRSQVVVLYLTAAASWWLMALAGGRWELAGAMVLGGVALATGNPATNELIASHAAAREQPVLLASKQAGAQLAGAAAGVLPAVGALWGWRQTLAVPGVVAVTAAVLAARLLPASPWAGATARGDDEDAAAPAVLRSDATRRLSLYTVVMGISVAAIVTYLPLYTHDVVGFSEALAGSVLVLLALVGFPALFLWTTVAARMASSAVLLTVMALAAAASTVAVMLAGRGAQSLLWPALVGLGLTYTTWIAVLMLTIVRGARGGRSGQISGTVLLAFFIGLTVGPAVFGWLTEAYSYDTALLVVAGLFVTGGAITYWEHRASGL